MDANSHLFQLERRKQILAMLESEGKILVKDLEKIFSVSGATIRSDLNDMEKEGLLLRTHGGAMEIQKTGEDASLEDRSKKRIKQKTAIAKVALSLIEPGESLFVDGGTTLTQFIQCLVEHPIKDLTILTNYHPHVLHLNECPEIKTVFIGGVYDHEIKAMLGLPAIQMIRSFKVDKVLISATGISLEQGITFVKMDDALVKQTIIHQGRKTILLTDSSKIGKASLISSGPLNDVDTLITDWESSDDSIKSIKDLGINLIIVPEPK